MALTFSAPVTLLWLAKVPSGGSGPGYCMQASSNSAGAMITLAHVNPDAGGGVVQQWVFGSEGRIYPWVGGKANTTCCIDVDGQIQSGTPLWLNQVSSSAETQIWSWSWTNHGISTPGAPGYYVDDDGGGTSPGTKIQIWSSASPNANEIWCPQLVHG